MFLLLAQALAGAPTTVFATNAEVVEWIRYNDRVSRPPLPVVAPYSIRRFEDTIGGNIRITHILPSDDPELAAVEARLDVGSPCALVLAPLDEGWAGWTSGACGMLSIGGWRWENHRVLDGANNAVMVPSFAAAAGDRATLEKYQKLDRARGRAIWVGLLGGGLLFASTVNLLDGSNDPASRVLQASGGALLATAGVGFAVIQVNPKAQPRRIDAHYTEAEIREIVRVHNRRMRIAWHPNGVSGTFF